MTHYTSVVVRESRDCFARGRRRGSAVVALESGELALVYDLLGGGATAREKLRERYLNARGVDLVLSVEPLTHSASGANTAAGQASWYLHDHLGTPRDTLRRSSTSPTTIQHWQQFRYDAWGRSQGVFAVTTGAPTTPPRIGFTGQVFDVATGLNYYQARYYDPDLGRFLSEDPAGFAAGELNLYRYVGNEPTRLVDPTGRNPARPYELTGLASSAYAMPGIGQSYQAPAGALPWNNAPPGAEWRSTARPNSFEWRESQGSNRPSSIDGRIVRQLQVRLIDSSARVLAGLAALDEHLQQLSVHQRRQHLGAALAGAAREDARIARLPETSAPRPWGSSTIVDVLADAADLRSLYYDIGGHQKVQYGDRWYYEASTLASPLNQWKADADAIPLNPVPTDTIKSIAEGNAQNAAFLATRDYTVGKAFSLLGGLTRHPGAILGFADEAPVPHVRVTQSVGELR